MNPDDRSDLYEDAFAPDVDAFDAFESLVASSLHRRVDTGIVDQMLYLDCKTFLEGDVLRNADMSSMANGLELRVPFLDDRLASLAGRLPGSAVAYGFRGGKRLLKRALRSLVPADVIRRPKRGFIPPASRWLRTGLRSFARDVLDPVDVRQTGILKHGYVTSMLEDHLSGHQDHTRKLTCLISFMIWWQARKSPTPIR